MKSLSQVLDVTLTNAREESKDLSLIQQRGSMPADGKTSRAITEIRSMAAARTVTPDQIDSSLKAVVKSWPTLSAKFEERSLYRDSQFDGVDTTVSLSSDNPDAVKELYRLVEFTCQPCPKDQIMREVYAMSISMARRKDQDDDFKMMIAVYADDLAEYPQDVIRDACKDMRHEQRFFPTISDLRDACKKHFRFRRMLLRELASIVSGSKLLSAG